MVVAHRNRARVGDVVMSGNVRHAKQIGDHARHLRLARRAIPAHRLFHLRRRVLGDGDALASERAEDDAARFADAHRGAPVGREEQLLHRGDLGSQRRARVDDQVEEDREPHRFTGLRHRLDARRVQEHEVPGCAVDDSHAGARQTGVDPEHSHPRLRMR